MLKNLLSNAIKYSPRGGRVRVGTAVPSDKPGMVELSVEDDGVGIAADALPRIFDPCPDQQSRDGGRARSGTRTEPGQGSCPRAWRQHRSGEPARKRLAL